MKILVREGQFFVNGFPVRRSFLLEEGESRLLSYVANGGCGVATLSERDGRLLVEGEGLLVVKRREGAELRPICYRPLDRASEVIEREGESYRVECRVGILPTLSVTGSAERTIILSTPIAAPRLRTITGQRKHIVELTADCPVGRYIAMISLSEGEVGILLEACGESILCEGNEVTVKRRFADRRGRNVTTLYTWQGDSFSSSREIAYDRDPLIAPEERGRELLECVLARDDDGLSALLSPEMRNPAMIYDYFGEIVETETPASASVTAAGAIVRKEGELVALTYDFDYDSQGQIENIRILDEP